MASTNSSNNSLDFDYYFDIFEKVSISSSVFLSIVALATLITNGISLYAIYKDPLKCFRNPFSVFITGIVVSDFLTGLVVEPVFVACYALWLGDVDLKDYIKLIRSSQILSAVTINTSFLTVLALAVAQLLAFGAPSLYSRIVKTPFAIAGVILIWIYAILFALLPEIVNMDIETYFKIDLGLHTTAISVALVIIYVVIYFVFARALRRHKEASDHGNETEASPEEISQNIEEEEETQQRRPTRISNEKLEKDFLIGSIILIAVLMVTVWPFTISLHIWMYRRYGDFDTFLKDYIALVCLDNVMFLKFLFDPLIFVWRISKYRKAISIVLTPLRVRILGAFGGDRGVHNAEYHRQTNEDSVRDSVEERVLGEREWSADMNSGVLEIKDA